MTTPRAAAHASLISCLKNGKYTNLEINAVLERSTLSGPDRRLYTALVYGVIERLITLDFIIGGLTDRQVSEIDVETLCALRLGVYQLAFMDRIPDHAAVSESVELVPKKAKSFVNAVLRSFQRKGCTYDFPKKTTERLSVQYSVPTDLCSFFIERYGEDKTEAILNSFFRKPEVALCINTLKTTAVEVAEELGGRISALCPDSVLVSSFDGVVEGIKAGKWFVQDEASSLCALVLGAQPGDLVADTCAAPGGKSFAVAIGMKNRGKVHAFDLHENKLSLIQSGADKLGISILTVEMRDAREPDTALVGKCDRVLCDAPCSGLGVIAKKPDIRYKSLDSVRRLPEIQYAVLCGSAEYVKPGGILVYSTCTLNPDENEKNAEKFLLKHKNFILEPFLDSDGMLTLFPHIHGTDGFFICKMKRVV